MGHEDGKLSNHSSAASAADFSLSLAAIAARVHTVNADTGLSTDFLNQYNELSMLVDLAVDDPDMLEDLEDWSPRSYEEHFAASGFKDWPLVVEAYKLSPSGIREEFDSTVDVLNNVATTGLASAFELASTAAGPERSALLRSLAAEIQGAIVHLGGLINGTHAVGSQARVDTLFARTQAEQFDFDSIGDDATADVFDSLSLAHDAALPDEGEILDQDSIDALFD